MPGARILVVEDDAEIRQLLGAVLTTEGHDVVEAPDGPAALPTAQRHAPDVVLLDLGLPGLDGFAVLEQLKADPQLHEVPVLMVTAWSETDLVAKALRLGAFDYVRKPFDIAELRDRTGSALREAERRRAGREAEGRAAVDTLTGVANRHRLTTELERRLGDRTEGPLSVVLLGLDAHGDLVAAHGAETADALVRASADRLVTAAGDALVGRWAEQEFLVLADGAGDDAAGALADRLAAAVAAEPFATPLETVTLTACCGVATWQGESVERLLGRVDAALHSARGAGAGLVRAA